MNHRVSIVLKTWNAIEYTKVCIESLNKYTTCEYELIIVDNGSTDGTKEYLKSLKNVILIFNQENIGCIKANEQGINKAKGDYICLLDNDTLVSKGWLVGMLNEFEQYPEEKIGVVGPFQLGDDFQHPYQKKISSKGYWKKITDSIPNKSPQDQLRAYCGPMGYDLYVDDYLKINSNFSAFLQCPPDFLGGSCLLFSKNAYESIGEKYEFGHGLYGGDDVELCWKMEKAGFKVYRSGRSYVHHFKHASIKQNHLDYDLLNMQSCEKIFPRWSNELQTIVRDELKNGKTIDEIITSSLMLRLFIYWLPNDLLDNIIMSNHKKGER